MKKGKLYPYFWLFALLFFIAFMCKSCDTDDDLHQQNLPFTLNIPQGFPHPTIPENNQLTQERINLGKMLFFDPILSRDSTISCATCHNQNFAFADNIPTTSGIENRAGTRNVPTLSNLAYQPHFLSEGGVPSLEMQVLVPFQEHNEFDFNIVEAVEKLKNVPTYSDLTWEAYDREMDAFVLTRSIAAFERTLLSGNSKFDQFFYQNQDVLSDDEVAGMVIFENLGCKNCHNGLNFTSYEVENNGLYENYEDVGLQRLTNDENDKGKFKIPTLRNIEKTAPYMHDGSFENLNQVIEHYASGGKNHPNKNQNIQPFTITSTQKQQLISFLKTLTDEDFLNNEDFKNPFE